METYKEDIPNKKLYLIIVKLLRGKTIKKIAEELNVKEYIVQNKRVEYVSLLKNGFRSEIMKLLWDRGNVDDRISIDNFCRKNGCKQGMINTGCIEGEET